MVKRDQRYAVKEVQMAKFLNSFHCVLQRELTKERRKEGRKEGQSDGNSLKIKSLKSEINFFFKKSSITLGNTQGVWSLHSTI